ncbi:hypothetical protein [Thermogymnomonas acidicola]|nr:hypothetical protein [Thermogymnomonas acidicola]
MLDPRMYLSAVGGLAFTGVLERLLEVAIGVSSVVIAILWIPVALGFFSVDENRRYESHLRLRNAIIGTVIYALAVSGSIYGIFKFIAFGT